MPSLLPTPFCSQKLGGGFLQLGGLECTRQEKELEDVQKAVSRGRSFPAMTERRREKERGWARQ